MYVDCLRARKSIEFEQYILRDDAAGRRFLDLFVLKAREGLNVRLMLDGVGSRNLLASPMVDEIRRAGGRVYFYNVLGWRNLFSLEKWFPRNHNKTMLVDGEIAFIGSVCLSEEMRHWRDMHVRCTGEVAADVREDFRHLWDQAARRITIPSGRAKSHKSGAPWKYVVSHQLLRPNALYRELLREIRKARSSVCLVTPYFLPPWHLRRALRAAARRGVDVRVMRSERTDVPFADYVSHSYYPKLLKLGMRIFHFSRTVLHAKYAVIDDRWATIGSTNMDYLSLLRNREANIVVRDAPTVAAIRGHFDRDLLDCKEAGMAYYYRIPLVQKVIGYLGRGMRRVL
jgi:cardiolipin synthase